MNTNEHLKQFKILFFLICYVSTIYSETTINPGIIGGTWSKANSPYLIYGDILVPSDSLLTLEAGVIVEFQGEYDLVVRGDIALNGTVNDSVVFTAANEEIGWQGIRLIGPSTDTTFFQYCIFENVIPSVDYPDSQDGAITLDSNFVLKISHSRISNNINASQGCGIQSVNSILVLEESLLKENNNGYEGGAIYSSGSYLYINNNRFEYNISSKYYSNGGGISSYQDSFLLVSNNIFKSNKVERTGGAIYINHCDSALIIGNRFLENESKTMGGAMSILTSTIRIINNLICKNLAERTGLYSSGGGGLKIDESTVKMINNTIADNFEFGIYCDGSQIDFFNTILSNLESSESWPINVYCYDYNSETSLLNFYNCVIEGGIESIYHNIYDTVIGDTISLFYESPKFLDRECNMYQVDFNSVVYNKGQPDTSGMELPAVDLDGVARIIDDTIDIGAYEFNHSILNRIPKITQIPDHVIRPADSLNLVVIFSDADTADNHSVNVYSDNIFVQIKYLSGDSSGSTFSVVPDKDTVMSAVITVVVSDDSGTDNAKDSMYFSVYFTDTLNIYDNELDRDIVWYTDTVKIYQNTQVKEDITLLIKPGTYVEFQGQYFLSVLGRILVEGSESDSIYLNIKKGIPDSRWEGVRFPFDIHNSFFPPDTYSTFNYCVIDNANIGLYLNHLNNIYISNSEIKNCTQGIYCEGGATITNCSIHDNIGNYYGAGLYLDDYNRGTINMINCLVYNNQTTQDGGGIFCNGDDANLIGNQIYNNRATNGGGIFIAGTARLINNTITLNNATNGGGTFQNLYGYIVYLNNIFQYNKATENGNQINVGSTAENTNLYHNFIEGGIEDIYASFNKEFMILINNYYTQSDFIDTTNRNFNLTASSACINAGVFDSILLQDMDISLLDELVINDGRIDIGALEFMGTPENRLPFIDKQEKIFIRTDTATIVSIGYIELDSNDSITCELQNPSMDVEIDSVIVGEANVSFRMIPIDNWSGSFDLVINLLDRADSVGISNTDTIKVHVSNTHEFCGYYNNNIAWIADTILINCDITIGRNAVLDIAPGTVVDFAGEYILAIKGIIQAKGGGDDSILFTSTVGNWGGIIIEPFNELSGLKGDSSIFKYCIIEHSNSALNYNVDAALDIKRDEVWLVNSNIRKNLNRGISVYYGRSIKPVIHDNTICDNINGGMQIYGSPLVYNNIFERNMPSESPSGGDTPEAIKIIGGKPDIHNNIIRDNTGGAMEIGGHGVDIYTTVRNNEIYNNSSTEYFGSGGIFCHNLEWGNKVAIVGNLIYGNQNLESEGGGIHIGYISSGNVSINNNTIVKNNSVELGGGIFLGRGARVDINNNIFWGNIANGLNDQIGISNFNMAKMTNCVIEYGLDSLKGYEPYFDRVQTTNISSCDPLFRNYENNNYRLYSASECINSGTPDTSGLYLGDYDISGNPRITNGIVDIGVYEYIQLNCNDSTYMTEAEICNGETYNFAEQVLSTGGKYYIFEQSYEGCDSIICLNLIVHPLPVVDLGVDTIIDDDDQLVLKVDDIYQQLVWYDGTTTNQVTVEGNMGDEILVWIEVTDTFNCSNSDSIIVTITDLDEIISIINTKSDVHIFPNPTREIIFIKKEPEESRNVVITIHDINGKLVINEQVLSNHRRIDVSGINPGVYILRIFDNHKLIIQEKFVRY